MKECEIVWLRSPTSQQIVLPEENFVSHINQKLFAHK